MMHADLIIVMLTRLACQSAKATRSIQFVFPRSPAIISGNGTANWQLNQIYGLLSIHDVSIFKAVKFGNSLKCAAYFFKCRSFVGRRHSFRFVGRNGTLSYRDCLMPDGRWCVWHVWTVKPFFVRVLPTVICVRECNEPDKNSNSALRSLTPSPYPLHSHIQDYIVGYFQAVTYLGSMLLNFANRTRIDVSMWFGRKHALLHKKSFFIL